MTARAAPAVDHANVRFPPPLLFAAVVGTSAGLQRLAPLPLSGLGAGRVVGGWALVAVGGSLIASAVGLFKRARTSLVPIKPTAALVALGPYRFTRNPMYLGLVSVTAGVGLLRADGWVLLLLVPAAVIADLAFVRPEERYLQRRFGDEYAAYRQQVRRWL